MGRLFGRVARVNLTTREYNIEKTDEYNKWLGGRGYGDNVLLNEVPPETSPLSGGNRLVIATGCFTGTALPGSTRVAVVTKNVLNNSISYSSAGGNFGVAMKKAGFDALIIEGRAEAPTYLFLHEGGIDFKDASLYWGQTTWATEDGIKSELQEADIQVAAIGPAGENSINIACIITGKAHAAAWGGSGAVMGSKNLKAIVAKGTPR